MAWGSSQRAAYYVAGYKACHRAWAPADGNAAVLGVYVPEALTILDYARWRQLLADRVQTLVYLSEDDPIALVKHILADEPYLPQLGARSIDHLGDLLLECPLDGMQGAIQQHGQEWPVELPATTDLKLADLMDAFTFEEWLYGVQVALER
jgi:hypothetical protein